MPESRVMGPPGCGKTTYLSKQIAIAAQRFGSDRVMVASFTRAAAAELVGRDLPLERDMIGTLHAHCYRQLGMPQIANDKKVLGDWNEKHPDLWLTPMDGNIDDPLEEGASAGEGDKLFNQYNVYRAKMIAREMWPLMPVRRFGELWDAWKRSQGVMDFTDLIELCYTGASAPPGKPDVIFLDEVQDFTKIELALARKWGLSAKNLVLAGDDDQCIYNFKGSTPDAFLDPPLPESQVRVLSQSYRVPRSVQAYSQRWIRNVTNRYEKEYNPRDFEGEILRLRFGTWKQPGAVIEMAQKYLDKGKTVMFLTTCSYMLNVIKTVLRSNGMPFQNQYRRSRRDWNPLHITRGTSTVERLMGYLRLDEGAWGDDSRMWTIGEVKKWGEMLKVDGVFQRGAKSKLLDMGGESEEMPSSLLAELLTDNAFSATFDNNVHWLYEHCLDSYKKSLEFPLNIGKYHGFDTLRKEPKLLIGTIHSVKGGEADVVFVFPDLSVQGYEEWDNTASRDVIYRQFYVGFTRARETLVLCNPESMRAVPI